MITIEEYEKEIAGKIINIVVKYDQSLEFPYYVISSINVDGAGSTLEEAKEKCEGATRMSILINQ